MNPRPGDIVRITATIGPIDLSGWLAVVESTPVARGLTWVSLRPWVDPWPAESVVLPATAVEVLACAEGARP